MAEKIKVIHYINQFFGGYGGEDKADHPLVIVEGATGPGKGLEEASGGNLYVSQTLICGDNYFQEKTEDVLNDILTLAEKEKPAVLVAGPAFNAGRYGLACRAVCDRVKDTVGIPTVTAMYIENPGVIDKPIKTYVLPSADSARGMKNDLFALSRFTLRLAAGEDILDAKTEGYIPRGIRKNTLVEKNSAARAILMLQSKLTDEGFISEIPLPSFEQVVPAPPVVDISKATLALATDGGVVPKGNPDHLESARAGKWFKYSIKGLEDLDQSYESIHGGFDLKAANEDPDRIVPLDAMKLLEKEAAIGTLYEAFYSTTGMTMPITNAVRIGGEMAADMLNEKVEGVILTGT